MPGKKPSIKKAEPPVRVINIEHPEAAQQKRRLVLGVVVIMIFVLIGWFFTLRYEIFKLTAADNVTEDSDWQKLKQTLTTGWGIDESNLNQQIAALKVQQDALKASLNLTPEQAEGIKTDLLAEATKDWSVYTDEKNGFSFKYPTDWQMSEEKNIVSFKSEADDAWQLELSQKFIAPKLTADKIENLELDAAPATVYHQTIEGRPLDLVVVVLPAGQDNLLLRGYGDNFNQMFNTFKFKK